MAADVGSRLPAGGYDLPAYSLRSRDTMLSVPEQIADRICTAILNGDYQPGERVPEVALAQAFGVSRGPVREALRLLESEGLVTVSPRRGAQITALTPEEVVQLFDIRTALSSLAAERAAANIRPDELAYLNEVVAAMPEAAAHEDARDYVTLSSQAGLTITRAARNPRLLSMILSLSRQTLRYAQLGLSTVARRQESAAGWKELSEAIARRDGAAAAQLNARMIVRSREAAMQLLTKADAATDEDPPK